MKCKYCGRKLVGEYDEMWINGCRITFCKNSECKIQFIRLSKKIDKEKSNEKINK
jgi:ribosome-binding protein aMBF1 (putative translation factor)